MVRLMSVVVDCLSETLLCLAIYLCDGTALLPSTEVVLVLILRGMMPLLMAVYSQCRIAAMDY